MSRPTLYLFVGFPGAGKTSIAKVIHEATGATHLWADKIRRERLGPPNYTHKENLELYEHLNQMTGELLRAGNSVVYDTNFKFRKDRDLLRDIAHQHGAETVVVWLTTPQALAKHRATESHHQGHTRIHGEMSPADFDRLVADTEWPDASEHAVQIDGTTIDSAKIRHTLNIL
ncbi:MAG TPA: ATP-binding protein [Candidatus Saccharimonadales bacterium]|nr:ATP-binding protein [Candidatus Saccharimonadales bacterium]